MQSSESGREHRAAAPVLPKPTSGFERQTENFQRHHKEHAGVERRSMVRGLILLAVMVLVGSIARAGLDRVFVPGWWNP